MGSMTGAAATTRPGGMAASRRGAAPPPRLRPSGKPRLQTAAAALVGTVALVLAALAAVVGAALLGIVSIAEEARQQTVPRVVLQQRDALAAAQLGRLAEVILNSHDRGRRATALEEAETLALQFAERADRAAVERLDRALAAVRYSNHRADLIDSLSNSVREGLGAVDEVLARATRLLAEPDKAIQDYAFLSNLYQLRRLYGEAVVADTPELLGARDQEILTLIRAQRALLDELSPAAAAHMEELVDLLQRISDARTLTDLHRGRLAVQRQMRQDIDTAHRLLRELAEGLASGAASSALATADRIVDYGRRALWTGIIGVGATFLVLLGVAVLLLRHVVRPVRTLSDLLQRLPDDPQPVTPPRALLEEFDRIGQAVTRFAGTLVALHAQAGALRTGEARLGTILHSAPFPIMIARRSDGVILFANAPTGELLALPPSVRTEALRLGLADFLDDPAEAMALPATLYRLNRATSIETRFRSADGRVFWGILTAVAMEYEGVGAMFLAVQDMSLRKDAENALRAAKEEAEAALTDLQRTQRSLVQAEKLASLGALVAGVAHEINTPVGIGVTASSFLAEEVRKFRSTMSEGNLRRRDLESFMDRVQEASAILLANLERAGTLVNSFKQVAVDQTSEARRSFELRGYLEDVLGSLAPHVKRTRHRVSLVCPDDIVMDGYPGALSQVVSNLVINALTHAFAPDQAGAVAVAVRADAEEGWILLEVADDGAGIPFDLRERVFEPFFTTRRGDGGSGLGLHIVHNIVVGTLGGAITLACPAEGGCRFTLRLPLQAPVPLPGPA
ncbi:sensor histidine kinase [Azospirillum thermophilum]|nr:HAMP domain-containing sensor histidine kinase [Azospirillum thermophilum]